MSGLVYYTCCRVDTGGNHELRCPVYRLQYSWSSSTHLHDFREVHHYGPDLKHYCPTGFEDCDCGEVREAEGKCRRWGT